MQRPAIGDWSGVPFSVFLDRVGADRRARFVGFKCFDDYFTSSANNNVIPYQLTFDGLIQYEVDHWKFALNGYNLTDELYYTEAFNNRATPAPGRTVLFTAGTKF